MNRRAFISQNVIFSAGCFLGGLLPCPVVGAGNGVTVIPGADSFIEPGSCYRPFVRWWWNGNKVEAKELIRELHLLKDAGIGGVEINPISFPSTGDGLGKKPLTWLSDEWIDMLQVTFSEAKKLDMSCDLIVGSGWPFGSEMLKGNERAKVVLVYAEKLQGPTTFETSQFNIFDNIDPKVTEPYPGRTFKILSLKLVPDPMGSIEQVVDFSDKCGDEIITVDVPTGKYVLYALVKVDSFASVINGAPGAAGPILNHMDKSAVRKYLDNMSDTIQEKTGPLSNHLRSFFADGLELEGCNWSNDIAEEFKKRRGYDIMPYLPFILFKVGRLGIVVDYNYGAEKTGNFAEEIKRIRFDFDLTIAELLDERFTKTYLQWCKDNNVKSRAEIYGKGVFTLEGSFGCDIPEGESWTTNWLKHRLGEEMPDMDYRRGRGYTMINKYVSSAAHLTGKRIVSCEEMTNTYLVFNATPELLKIGSDQSIMSGITHSVWHGFNYSPPEAQFPGWVQYGAYHNENNNWWPYFKYLNDYKARISSVLQNADMYTDIAILPANNDMWGEIGSQTDPFPAKLNVPYTSIIWESVNKNGGGVDYTSETVIKKSEVKNGDLCYGAKQYNTLFLVEVTSMFPETLEKLCDFVISGGRVFCIGKYPEKSLGFANYSENDKQVRLWVEKLKAFPDRFVLVKKPDDNRFLEWYGGIMKKYSLPHYLEIEKPNRFLMQNRYRDDAGNEIFFFSNAHMHNGHKTKVTFPKEITKGRFAWIWDAESGDKSRICLQDGTFLLELGPAESRLLVFNNEKNGKVWAQAPSTGNNAETINNDWEVELRHSRENSSNTFKMYELQDLKDTKYVNFTGTAVYRKTISFHQKSPNYLNLGKVWGVSELFVNGKSCGVKWYGNRIYDLSGMLKGENNKIEVHVVTSMGNYMKTLKDNKTAQKFTVLRSKNQPIQSMGLLGPVTVY